MRVTFWGTRGSMPTPLKNAELEEKLVSIIRELPADLNLRDSEAVRRYLHTLPPLARSTAGGNTPCIEVRAEQQLIVLDAGTGLRELGRSLMQEAFGQGQGTLHLFISHPHWDHIQGFTMFYPLFVPGNRIHVYGVHDFEAIMRHQLHPTVWPVQLEMLRATVEFHKLSPGETVWLDKVCVDTLKNEHPGDSYSFRVRDPYSTLVYMTDVEYKDLTPESLQKYIAFLEGADALIFDAQYTLREAWQRVDWGHSSAMIGVDLTHAAHIKRLYLFHHDPLTSDEKLMQILRDTRMYQVESGCTETCKIEIAIEGLTVDLTPEHAMLIQSLPDTQTALIQPARTLDEASVTQLAMQLNFIEGQVQPVIDLSHVETLTTSGLQALVALQRTLGMPLILTSPSERMRLIIRLAGYQDSFIIYPTLEAAQEAIRVREQAHLPGQLLDGRYQIESYLGETALGTVLKAHDIQEDYPVAVKLLAPTFSPETLEHLGRQYRAIMGLNHPNIVKVFAWVSHPTLTYIVEEYVEHPSLADVLKEREGPFPGEEALEIAFDISNALEYAHSHGVIHGDLHPNNIFLTPQGARVTGFGLGRVCEGQSLRLTPLLYFDAAYLAPEQILGQPLDARVDLYALGVILYRLFTGRLPFTGSTPEVMEAHLKAVPEAPTRLNPALSRSLEHLILKLLAKNPNERYGSSQQTRRMSGSLLRSLEEAQWLREDTIAGRQEELALILEAWEQAASGHGRLLFVAGEEGIGKSTLVHSAALQSNAPVVLYARAEEGKPASPYALFRQVLEAYLETVPPEFFATQVQPLLSSLAQFVPSVKKMLPEELQAPAPNHNQQRMINDILSFIRYATQERPWFVVLEDLQWSDADSLDFLEQLGRQLPDLSLLIVGTYRSDNLSSQHPLMEALGNLAHYPGYRLIVLERLSLENVERQLRYIWHLDMPRPLVEKIYQHTTGNPLYVEEIIKALMDEGQIVMRDGVWHYPDPDQITLPDSVRDAVLRRVNMLPQEAQNLLRQAAILGQSFRFQELQAMTRLKEWELLDQLDLLFERQFLEEVRGEQRLRFRHPEVQQTLYEEIGPLRRRILHRQAGEALEQDTSTPPEILAQHFSQAEEYAKAITYGMLAAYNAEQAYANAAALRWYRHALDLFLRMKAPERHALMDVHLTILKAMGRLLLLEGRDQEALEQYTLARTILNAMTPSATRDFQQAEVCQQIALIYERRNDFTTAWIWIERGLNHIRDHPPTPELANLYHRAGWIALRQESYPEARQMFERSLSLARELGLARLEADNIRAQGVVAWYTYQDAEAEAHFQAAFETYHALNYAQGEAYSLNNLGIVANNKNDYAQAHAYYEQALAIYRRIGDMSGASGTLHNFAMMARNQGRFEEALDLAQQALTLRQQTHNRRGEGMTLDLLGTITTLIGDGEQAESYLQKALAIVEELEDHEGIIEVLTDLAWLKLRTDQAEQAVNYIQRGLRYAEKFNNVNRFAQLLIHLGNLQLAQGAYLVAEQTFLHALSYRERVRDQNLPLRVYAGLGLLALHKNQREAMRRYADLMVDHLNAHPMSSLDEPYCLYGILYRLLQALDDPRAAEIRAAALARREQEAAQFSDEERRARFLAQPDQAWLNEA